MAHRAAVLGLVLALAQSGPAAAAPAPGTPAASPAETYRVQPGDTLSRIATRLRVGIDALAGANGIRDRNRVVVGSVLRIPRRGAPSKPARRDTTQTLIMRGGVGQHVVARGESLSSIAARHHVAPSVLLGLNGLPDANHLRPGQRLRVPASAWRCPVRGMAAGSFSDSWGSPRPGGRRHLGTDLFARRGTAVLASVDGTITHVIGRVAGRAFYLRGDDGTTYYGAHLDAFSGPPRRVRAGEVIGTVGRTGNAERTPPHLHFEIKPAGGAPVNPYPTLRAWCR